MYTYVILHNMIIEDNGCNLCELEQDCPSNPNNFSHRSWSERVKVHHRMDKELRDSRVHRQLRNALIEHIWNLSDNYHDRNY